MSNTNQNTFSFIELDKLINQNYSSNKEEHNKKFSSLITPNETKNKEQKLKFEPNSNVARININEKDENQDIQEQKDKNKEKSDIIIDITKNFKGEESLIKKVEKMNIKENKKKKEINKEVTYKYNPNEDINMSDKALPHSKKEKKKTNPEEYGILNAIKNIKKKDPDSYVPILLPFGLNKEESNNKKTTKDEIYLNNNELNENNIFVIQFPKQIPIKSEEKKKQKMEENNNDEPMYDDNGYLIQPEFKNVFKEIPKYSNLGKLKIFKSGKVKMEFGNVLFDVIPGSFIKFAQQASIIKKDNKQTFLLGKINSKKLIVIPEIN